jgi:N-acetylmuramoyl-L-alanine amidase
MGFRVSLMSALSVALLLAPMGSLAGEATPTATAVEVVDQNGAARLSFDLTADVGATARPVIDPDRILIDLPEVAFTLEASAPHTAAKGALIASWRAGSLAPGKSRIVVDLARRSCITKLAAEPKSASAPARLVLELAACDERRFASAVTAAPLVATPPVATAAMAPLPVIVLDPGHGGADGGAHGAHGAVEKAIVFDFAMALRRKLEASGRYKIVMTRDDDEYVSLEDRVQIAEDANAALMISIHADSFPAASASQAADVFGTTVYTCSDRASDAEAARIAARENAADRDSKAKSPQDGGVADILFSLKRRETRAYAHIFSRGLVGQLKGIGRLNRNPERSAGFFVLKAPDYPSVLVELGYISNADDVANMTNGEWRQRSVAAIAAAVDRFFAPEGGEAKPGQGSEALATSERPLAPTVGPVH